MRRAPAAQTVHASAVSIGGTGVLIRGSSGSGKSSLALGLIMADRKRRRLVADDRIVLSARVGRLFASAPEEIAGLLEVRGQGLLPFPHLPSAEIGLVVDIVAADAAPRMPEPADSETELCGVVLPRLFLPIGIADGPVRVALAVERLPRVKPLRASAEKSLALRNRSVEIGRPARKRRRAEF
jgi:serine kinase of HPr protein (carbohydrate metabolism regulator)